MQESSDQHDCSPSTWTVDDVDVEFLPLIYEIIRSLEKDPHDNTPKPRDSQDTTQKILELQRKLEKAREQVRKLRGIEYNTEEQLRQLEVLRNQLRLKRELLHKYHTFIWSMGLFRRFLYFILHDERNIQRLSDSRPIRFLARICAGILMEAKIIAQDQALKNIGPKAIKDAASNLSKEFKKTIQEAKEEIKKGLK